MTDKDSEGYRSEEKIYDDLPGCCQYERPAAMEPKKGHEEHNH